MKIHTVKKGETVFHIARRYNTSPVKVIEDNALARPDALSVGDELLILIPTRTHTVRGAETLSQIAQRFGVRRSDIIRNNPSLSDSEALRPGTCLTIKHAPPKYGTAASLGYVRRGCSADALRASVPFLSYYAIDAGHTDGLEITLSAEIDGMRRVLEGTNRITLLCIRAAEVQDSFFADKNAHAHLMDRMIACAKQNRYQGIVLEGNVLGLATRALRDEFLIELRRRMIGSDLILFCECHTHEEFGDYADANILLPCCFLEKDDFTAEHKVAHAIKLYESQKTFLGWPTYALDEDEMISYKRMREIAYQTKSELSLRDDLLEFTYTRFVGGQRKRHHVRTLSMQTREWMLALLSEYGFMGCAIEVEHFDAPSRLLLNQCFSGVDYAFSML